MNSDFEEPFLEEPSNEQEQEEVKILLSKILFDRDNIDMITKVEGNDVDRIASLQILVDDENELRQQKGYPPNIMGKVVNQHLILRTSIDGWRAIQGENIIKSNIEASEQGKVNEFKDKLKSILGSGK